MKTKKIIYLTLLTLIGCSPKTKCKDIKKPIEQIKAVSDLSQRLDNDIIEIAFNDYRDGLESSVDTIDVHKREIAYQLYQISRSISSISHQLRVTAFFKSNNLTRNQADTASEEYMINKYANPFESSLLSDTIIKSKFLRLIAYQDTLIKIRETVIKTQTGKGKIICRDLGHKLSLEDLNSVTDYWDLLYLIENSHYTISKDILCAFSNLSCYKKEIRWRFSTRYSGNPDETLRQTRHLKKSENGT